MMRLVAARLAQIFGVHFLEQRVLVALADGLRVILAVQGCGAQGLQVRKVAHTGRLRGLAAAVYTAAWASHDFDEVIVGFSGFNLI